MIRRRSRLSAAAAASLALPAIGKPAASRTLRFVPQAPLTALDPGFTHANVIRNHGYYGPDRRTAYLGSIAGDRLWRFQAPVAGEKPVHWDW